MATNGSAIRVMSDPKIEIVAAVQTRTKAPFRHSWDPKGERTTMEPTWPPSGSSAT